MGLRKHIEKPSVNTSQNNKDFIKPTVQSMYLAKKGNGENEQKDPSSLESTIHQTKGKGSKLSKETQNEMEQGIGSDFSNVNIHTDDKAAEMSNSIGAHAFTHGNDIYFNKGNYNPQSKKGKHLLAHELTHTVQQTGGKNEHNIGQTSKNVQGGFWGNLWRGTKRLVGHGWNYIKSKAAWAWSTIVNFPERLKRLIKHFGVGMVNLYKWVKGGLHGLWKHFGKGIKKAIPWLKNGLAGFGRWVLRGYNGGKAWAKKILKGDFSGFWSGIGKGFKWLGSGIAGLASWGWTGLKGALRWAGEGLHGFSKWLWRGMKGGAAWVGHLITKLLDLGGIPELVEIYWHTIKWNMRTMTSSEIKEAKKVFENSLSYWQVRIDEKSAIAWIGAYFSNKNKKALGVTTFHTINFNKKVDTSPNSEGMALLIHELVHVGQYENVGSSYIAEAVHAQHFTKDQYDYGFGKGLVGKKLSDFNREQQGRILQHYYLYIIGSEYDSSINKYESHYIRMANDAINGKY